MTQSLGVPSWCAKQALVLGCGNVLFGDDGFGPCVAERLRRDGLLPPHAEALDVGTAVREILFDLILAPQKPSLLVIVDCTDFGARPGVLRRISVDEIARPKQADLTLHQAPTVNLLSEFRNGGHAEVVILAVQSGFIPAAVAMGLSPAVARAVPRACRVIAGIVNRHAPQPPAGRAPQDR